MSPEDEAAFRDLGNSDAVDIPRQDAIVPIARAGAVHDLKTMSGTWPQAGIAAIKITTAANPGRDVGRWERAIHNPCRRQSQ